MNGGVNIMNTVENGIFSQFSVPKLTAGVAQNSVLTQSSPQNNLNKSLNDEFVKENSADTNFKSNKISTGTKILSVFSAMALAGGALMLYKSFKNPKQIIKTVTKIEEKIVPVEVVKEASEKIVPVEIVREVSEKIIPVEVKEISQTALGKEFLNSNKGAFAFIKEQSGDMAGQIKEFLFALTADKKAGVEFVEEITNNPRESREIITTLVKKIGGENNFLDWYKSDSGYIKAYQRYLGQVYERFQWGNASLDDLLKINPNWRLSSTAQRLAPLGKIPEEIGGERLDFEGLLKELRTRVKDTQKEFDFGDLHVKFLTPGATTKSVAQVSKGDKSFIVKFQTQFIPEREQSIYQGQIPGLNLGLSQYHSRTAADSIFSNAKIDRYLTQNGCKNSAALYYYSPYVEASIYEFLPVSKDKGVFNFLKANSEISDANKLGVFMNDVNYGNFSQPDANGVKKIVDSGHCGFKDLLRPTAYVHFDIVPNSCGFDYTDLAYRTFLKAGDIE